MNGCSKCRSAVGYMDRACVPWSTTTRHVTKPSKWAADRPRTSHKLGPIGTIGTHKLRQYLRPQTDVFFYKINKLPDNGNMTNFCVSTDSKLWVFFLAKKSFPEESIKISKSHIFFGPQSEHVLFRPRLAWAPTGPKTAQNCQKRCLAALRRA